VQPIQPNYGTAFINAQFESAVWIIEIAMWSSGEAELASIHLPDDLIVNKHYDLTSPADLAVVLDELTALPLRGGGPRRSGDLPCRRWRCGVTSQPISHAPVAALCR
jgi:hypothetical protein